MSLTGYLSNDGRDLSNVFIGINNGALIASQNVFRANQTFAGGIDLSNSFLYSRNDVHLFNAPINSKYPVGYTVDTSFNTGTPLIGSGSSGTIYTVSTSIYPGKWMINYRVSVRGIAATPPSSLTYGDNVRLIYELSPNSNIVYSNFNTIPKHILAVQSGSLVGLSTVTLGIKNVATVKENTILVASGSLVNGPAGGSMWIRLSLGITKLA